jgi:hypothetical protein
LPYAPKLEQQERERERERRIQSAAHFVSIRINVKEIYPCKYEPHQDRVNGSGAKVPRILGLGVTEKWVVSISIALDLPWKKYLIY